MSYIGIIITYVFIQNFILVQFMGLCPFIGVSKNSESAVGMGMAVTFVTAVASVVCYAVYTYLLVPFGLEYLETISFILVIAALVQMVEMGTWNLPSADHDKLCSARHCDHQHR